MIKVNQDLYDHALELLLAGRWRIDEHRGILATGSDKIAGSLNTSGYYRIRFTHRGKWAGALAHRVMWEALRGPIPEGMYVNHIDGDKTNNAIANLELVTHHENMKHAYATGLMRGVDWATPRDLARDIFVAAWTTNESLTELADRFGVTTGRVKGIKYRAKAAKHTEDLAHLKTSRQRRTTAA